MNYSTKFTLIAIILFISVAIATFSSTVVSADTVAPGSTGDTAWLLICSGLVFFMVPGLAFFYGGMLRKQSMTSIMCQCLATIVIMTIIWVICGYSLVFGSNGAIIGNLDYFFFEGLIDGSEPSDSRSLIFAVYQMMFAIITAAIIIGACAERVRFPAIVAIVSLWGLLVYVPVAHWIWGGGFLSSNLVMVDFAGGIVIHILVGVTALALAMFVGKRKESIRKSPAHNIPFVFIGALIIWFGWFGFNGGSGFTADSVAIRAIFMSQVSAVAATASWSICQYVLTGRVGIVGMVSGSIAGLGSVTPMAGYISAPSAFVVGIVGGILSYFAVSYMRSRSNIDDALDVFGVHGVSGFWGSIATGLFVEGRFCNGINGLFFGGTDLIVGQIVASAVVGIYAFAVSYAIIYLVSKITTLRVSEDEETIGQDIVEHGEPSYMI